MAIEIEGLTRQIVMLAGTKLGDRYVFSGFRTDVEPYAPPAAGTADAGPYLGDSGAILARVAPGMSIQVNVTADTAFGPALAALKQLHDELTAGTQVSGTTLTALDDALDSVITARSVLGTRANRLEATRESLSGIQFAGRRLLSELEDADLTEAVTELRERESVYHAALAATARILGETLFDHLR